MSSSSHSICRQYAKGGCPRGSRCRFRHVLPGTPHEDTNATNDNNKTSNTRWFNTTSERKERRTSSANPSSGANASTSSSSSASANASSSSNSAHIQSGRNRADAQNNRIPTTNGEGSGSKCAQKSTNREAVAESACSNAQERTNTSPSAIPCRFYKQGYCRYGSECWFLHEIPDKSGNKEAIADAEDTPTCSICYEIPTTFGLLVSCDHVFCIDCVRNWRKSRRQSSICSDQTKTCPLCRKKVPYVVPSSRVPRDAQDKDSIIDSYKAAVAKIPCKYFEETKTCPFGDLCLYQHANADGTRYIMGPPKRDRRRRIMWDESITIEDLPDFGELSFLESDVESSAWDVLIDAFETYGYDWEVEDEGDIEVDYRDSDEDAFVYHPSEEPEDILTFLPSQLDANEYDWGW